MNKIYIFSFILLYSGIGYIPFSLAMDLLRPTIPDDANKIAFFYKKPKNPSLFNRWFRTPLGYYRQIGEQDPRGLTIFREVVPAPAHHPYVRVYKPLFTKRIRNSIRFAGGFFPAAVGIGFACYADCRSLSYTVGIPLLVLSCAPCLMALVSAMKHISNKNDWNVMKGFVVGVIGTLGVSTFLEFKYIR